MTFDEFFDGEKGSLVDIAYTKAECREIEDAFRIVFQFARATTLEECVKIIRQCAKDWAMLSNVELDEKYGELDSATVAELAIAVIESTAKPIEFVVEEVEECMCEHSFSVHSSGGCSKCGCLWAETWEDYMSRRENEASPTLPKSPSGAQE